MANPKVTLKIKGIRQVLKSQGVTSKVARTAKAMADEAGEGFSYVVKPHKYTARAFVQIDPSSDESFRKGRERQSREHVLQRVVGRKR